MKKGYYLYVEGCGSSGVMKKIQMQVDTLAKNYSIEMIQIDSMKCSIARRALNLLPWNSFARDYEKALQQMDNPDFIYFRRTFLDKDLLKFLCEIKKCWPNCKLIVELMVYPYEKDMLMHPYTAVLLIKELLYRKHYRDSIDRFVTYSDDSVINGVNTIRTMNGVNVEEMLQITPQNEYCSKSINLIAVATFIKHHGYERVLRGLAEYYKKGGDRQIVIHFVGDGPEKRKYEKLAVKYKLMDNVIFYGARYGNELEEIYACADAGLVAFGVYKDKIDKLCTIKAREYLAKGIPCILGCEDELFVDKAKQYGIVFSNDSSNIDIEKLVQYLDKVYGESPRRSVNSCIRGLAYKLVDNTVTLKGVMDYIGY